MTDARDEKMERLRQEAIEHFERTGGPVRIQEDLTRSKEGVKNHTLKWRAPKQTAPEAVELIVQSGAYPQRDQDGVVRLNWPDLEKQTDEGGAGPRGHFEVNAWPIRSPETASLIFSFLVEQGWEPFTPRELRQTQMLLDARALRNQQRIDLSEAAERNPALEAILYFLSVRPEGWKGTASSLLASLNLLCEIEKLECRHAPNWPKDARSLAVQLQRFERWFADEGIVHSYHRVAEERQHILRSVSGVAAPTAARQQAAEAPLQGLAESELDRTHDPENLTDAASRENDAGDAVRDIKAGADRNFASLDKRLQGEELRKPMTQDDAAILDFCRPAGSMMLRRSIPADLDEQLRQIEQRDIQKQRMREEIARGLSTRPG